MNYYFAKLRSVVDGQGKEPDLPDEVGFLLLVDSKSSEWNLYECNNDTDKNIHIDNPVSNELKLLIDSGKRFPPSLAFVRDDISRKFEKTNPTLIEFQSAIVDSLRRKLSMLSRRNFFLIETFNDEIGYRSKSEWYWVVAVSKDKSLLYWVSDDYFIYSNPIGDFKISNEQLEILSR